MNKYIVNEEQLNSIEHHLASSDYVVSTDKE